MKKSKIFLTLSFMAILIVGGILYYFSSIKSYDTEDVDVKEIVSRDYKVKLPNENEVASPFVAEDRQSDGEASNISDKQAKHQQAIGPGKSSQKEADNSPASLSHQEKSSTLNESNINRTNVDTSSEFSSTNPNDVQKIVTSDTILKKYTPSFKDIEEQANQKVNELISYAVREYKDKKENGEEISYFYFYSKYSTAGKTLEANTDDSFNYIYEHLENELKQKGFDEKNALTFKKQYNKAKKQRKSQLMSKGMDALK
jgi:hypothetical protein